MCSAAISAPRINAPSGFSFNAVPGRPVAWAAEDPPASVTRPASINSPVTKVRVDRVRFKHWLTLFVFTPNSTSCLPPIRPPKSCSLINLLMKAIVYDAPRKFEYRDIAVPKIQPNEILLRVHACGVCGTDLHVHQGEFGHDFPSRLVTNLRVRS